MCPKMASKSARKGPLVWSAPINSVDSTAIIAIPKATGSQVLAQKTQWRRSFHMVVGRLTGDDDVVHVAFPQTGAGNAHELPVVLKLTDGAAPQVTHAGPQSAHKLVDH